MLWPAIRATCRSGFHNWSPVSIAFNNGQQQVDVTPDQAEPPRKGNAGLKAKLKTANHVKDVTPDDAASVEPAGDIPDHRVGGDIDDVAKVEDKQRNEWWDYAEERRPIAA